MIALLQALAIALLVCSPWFAVWLLARGLSQAFGMIEDIYRRLPAAEVRILKLEVLDQEPRGQEGTQ